MAAYSRGYLYYLVLSENSRENAHKEAVQLLKDLKNSIDSYHSWSLLSVNALAGIKELKQSLLNEDATTLAETNAILDHFKDALKVNVCCLMDNFQCCEGIQQPLVHSPGWNLIYLRSQKEVLENVILSCLCLGVLAFFLLRKANTRIIQRKKAEAALLIERNKRQEALSNIKELSGLLPICSSCKKVRYDKGYWN